MWGCNGSQADGNCMGGNISIFSLFLPAEIFLIPVPHSQRGEAAAAEFGSAIHSASGIGKEAALPREPTS